MGTTEALVEAALTQADVPGALALSAKVGWNQTAHDWRLFIAHGRTIGLFDQEAGLIATAAALPYDNGFGYISMVIVDPEWRRRGLARRLMGECIATLRGMGRAALLDATPAGALVYRGLGFVELATMERWEGEGGGAAQIGSAAERLMPDDLDKIVEADALAFGSQRHFLLEDFLARPGTTAWTHDGGYLVMRQGHRAAQIGPLVASSTDAARPLLATALAHARGRVFLDLFTSWPKLAALLEASGFMRQRPYMRMALDRATLPGDLRRLAIAAGPEFG
ncbi:MAG: GNAT family N-acetyltransferase [Hyphomicrobiales bacterium]|nr:GNAT family N-acetyltransferase [Hyphomicrobiales bacterium]MBV8823369.1 GNAT family N-acetyltransferase [Hyphomicrobiales bacterium]MBV9429559.1 GNAT family N-acetyltransferase [Bradyrhizobiaceae bacterium]